MQQSQVAQSAQLLVLKKAMDIQASTALALLQALPTNLPLATSGNVGTLVNQMVWTGYSRMAGFKHWTGNQCNSAHSGIHTWLEINLFISDMDVIKISRHHHIVIFIMALAIESLVGVGHRLMLCACVERGTPSISGMQRCPRMGVPRHLCQSMPWVWVFRWWIPSHHHPVPSVHGKYPHQMQWR